MKKTKQILYIFTTLLSCTLASQQFAMYGNLQRTESSLRARKAREAKQAEEKRRFDEAYRISLLHKNPVEQFVEEFDDKPSSNKSFQIRPLQTPSAQRSTETSPLPFPHADIQTIYLRYSNEQPSSQLTSGRTSLSTERTSSPFRVIIEVKDRTESPLQKRLLVEEREADPKRSTLSTVFKNVSHGLSFSTLDTPESKRVQSPIQEIPQSKYQPRAHSSMSYEDDISDHGFEGFHEDENHFPMDIDMDIE